MTKYKCNKCGIKFFTERAAILHIDITGHRGVHTDITEELE